ncbi:MAG: hypothetical protein E6G34_14200 [Actinobacteria bacterium]|nr:MAG: hypothetical protein E6G34_14200 [Actinomycetota bacterium]
MFSPGLTLARVVRAVIGVISAIIVLAIVLIVLDANSANTIVSHIREWADTLTAPFHGIFHLASHKATLAVNYGLAAIVYVFAGELLVRLLVVTSFTGRRPLPY